jgi:glycosyltransferase involved in cell wall biosynthesis
MQSRLLTCAYACNPYRGSEPGVGWGWVNMIARFGETWVLTDAANREDIERETSRDPSRYENLHFIYIPRTRWLRAEKFWPPAYLWTYRLWQREAYKLGCELHDKIGFSLVHVVTYVGFRVPGPFWKMDIPLVWGPIGGLENTPWRLLPAMGVGGAIHYGCRNVINTLHKLLLREPKQAFAKARGAIIAATSGIQREIERWYGEKSVVICEVGAPPTAADHYALREPGRNLRICWSGAHLPGKGLPLLLHALAKLPADASWEVSILGEGPCTTKWKRLARRLGIDARCTWTGNLSREGALETMGRSHVFVITSLKDLTSTVLLEALSRGLPVICPNHCGFADVVNDQCGVRLPIGSPRELIEQLELAILWLLAEEGIRRGLAAGALMRSLEFSWDAKASQLQPIYESKLGRVPAPVVKPRDPYTNRFMFDESSSRSANLS